MDRDSWRNGLRAGAPFAAASFVLSASFGVAATGVGFTPWAAVLMSAVVFAGSAQFAAVGVLISGGTAGPAVLAATLMNARFLPMGIAFGQSLPGGPVRRALQGQPVVDASWAMAMNARGRFDRWYLFGHSAIQYVAWVAGTTLGAYGGSWIRDPEAFGLDALFPGFFVALLFNELRDRQGVVVALGGAALALVLLPFTPPGVPLVAAALVALVGLHPRMERAAGRGPEDGEPA